jgi:hypothetical protein
LNELRVAWLSISKRFNLEENMKKIRYGLIVVGILVCMVTSATAGVSIGIGLPTVSIGINLPMYPELVRVPNYPVYYAPRMDANYFFYDGMYWVYQDDNWYASSWYNGPWGIVEPYYVPLFILRIPVSYYRQPPAYFRGWQSNAPPRWGQHWGRDWEQRRSGWNRWNRGSAPAPAPLPVYQRQYSGDRYPHVEQQQQLRSQQYRYQPRDKVVREHFKQVEQKAPAPAQRGRQEAPPVRSPSQNDQKQQREQKQPVEQRQQPRAVQPQQPKAAQPQREQQAPKAAQPQREQQAPKAAQPQREQQAPKAQERDQRPQDRGESQEPNRGRGQGQNKDDERGRGRDN